MRSALRWARRILLLLAIGTAQTAAAAPPGAVISNQAMLEYQGVANQPVLVASNVVEVTTAVERSASAVALTRVLASGNGTWQEAVGPSACLQAGVPVPLADPQVIGGNLIDPSAAHDVVATAAYNLGEVVFVRLADADQNIDFQQRDTATVELLHPDSGDSEFLRLTETGPDTGIFAGFLPTGGGAATQEDCVLQGGPQTAFGVRYTDPVDAADTASANALFDPVQRVFESRSGANVTGATVQLVYAANGQPATVYGNDGTSQYPSAVQTGGSVTDSSGTTYNFGPGEYRFPVVPDGDYRLVVTPPPAYVSPSTADPNALQNLPGAPYALGGASFGQPFTKSGELSFAWDIPVDPRAEVLFLQKRTMTTMAAPGDFVRYELALENAASGGAATNVVVTDILPTAVRYVPGSARVDGVAAADPVSGDDPGELEFRFALLDPGGTVRMSYVVEVVGGKPNEELVNRATAEAAGGLVSNEATAVVRVTEDLFRSTGTIIGRVLEGDCSQASFSEEQGVAGVRVYLEDGSYSVTDEGGRFHFEGVRPGTHVAQLDTDSVPAWFDVMGCADTPGYAQRADSQFVKLDRGSLKRADFYLRRKPAPEGRIDLELRSEGTDDADRIRYELKVDGVGNVAISNIDVMLLLPDGVTYAPGTLRVDGKQLGEPHRNGQVLSLALPDRTGNWSTTLDLEARIADRVSGEQTTKATARFDSPIEKGQTTPVAETKMLREPGTVQNAGYVLNLKFAVLSDTLSAADRQTLDALIRDWKGVRNVRLSVVGHSDSQPIAPHNQHLFSDNYVLSHARAKAAADYVAGALGLARSDMQVTGRGPDEPVAENTTSAGRARNRRVEMVLSGVRPQTPSFLEVTKATSGTQAVETRGAVPGTEVETRSKDDDLLVQVEPPLDTLSPGVAILLPDEGYAPAVPATKLSVQHAPDQSVDVFVNGQRVNPVNFDTLVVNRAGTVAVSRWAGVELDDGENRLRAIVRNADGSQAAVLERTINYSGQPIRAEFVASESVLIADGKTRPVVAIRLFDRSGKPARQGMTGGFRVLPPYRSWWDVENDRRNPLVQVATREPTYRIGKDGIARIELEPTTRTGEVELSLLFENQRQQELQAWLKPAPRDWILVGFAEGTAGYNTLADNAEAATAAGLEDEYYDDGRVAFFAKGRIRGEYLLTLAYDSDRELEDTGQQLTSKIDPNRYYPLYADTAERRFEAASQRKLFVKLERNQFYAMFGDFETGLVVTDLARYQRSFNGLLSEYRGDNAGYTAFAAESRQAFNRDELRGDGTSGLYYLSNVPIVVNSEEIRIEVRDRFDSGIVLESRVLSRFLDYSLDPLDGSLYFKQPIPSRDLDFNPVYIVAEYESLAGNGDDIVAGGRASVYTGDDNVEVGVTRIDDGTTGAEAALTGVDLRWQINSQTLLTAEMASTDSTVGGTPVSGSAHRIELEHNGENVDVRAFMREVEDDFGLGYQSAADQGVRRLGIEARATLGEHWRVEGEAGWQQMLATEDIRNLARGRVRYERQTFSASAGLTHAEDAFEDGDTRASDLLDLGLTKKLFDSRLTLRVNSSSALNDDAESLDYPTRLVFGADYRLTSDVDLLAEYEQAEGRDIESSMTRVGVRAKPWARAQIESSLGNEVTEFGPRLFANLGLIQGFAVGEHWLFDVGVDQSNTLTGPDARPFDEDRELASGSLQDDFVAVHTGALYTADLWSANGRVEYRNSDTEERTSVLFGWYREPQRGHGLSAGLTTFIAEPKAGGQLASAVLRFGWAWRPAYSPWSFLNRVDLRWDNLENATVQEDSIKLVNNFNANRRIGAATELALQYAFKVVQSRFDGLDVGGYSDLVGLDFRHGFGRRWDAGIGSSLYHAWESGTIDYGVGVDIGYNVATNAWLTLGYNLTGFHDEDFALARYTAQGPYLRFTFKADQRTLKDIAGQR